MTIIEHLAQERDAWKTLGGNGAWLPLDFFLATGHFYPGRKLPRRYVRRPAKACFYNARQLVLRSKTLHYAEGYAMGADLPICFHHAWALDPAERVIDPTLRQPEAYQFFGIKLAREWLKKEWRYTGVLCDEFGWRDAVLRALNPNWALQVLDRFLSSTRTQPAGH